MEIQTAFSMNSEHSIQILMVFTMNSDQLMQILMVFTMNSDQLMGILIAFTMNSDKFDGERERERKRERRRKFRRFFPFCWERGDSRSVRCRSPGEVAYIINNNNNNNNTTGNNNNHNNNNNDDDENWALHPFCARSVRRRPRPCAMLAQAASHEASGCTLHRDAMSVGGYGIMLY
jgi:hypothetical protein